MVVGPQLLQLGQGVVLDPAGTVGGALQGLVVDHHQLAVPGQVHVQLDAVGSLAGRQGKGGQGVFGGIAAGPPVGEDFGLFHGGQLPFGPAVPVFAPIIARRRGGGYGFLQNVAGGIFLLTRPSLPTIMNIVQVEVME